jgi:hypothetical protein
MAAAARQYYPSDRGLAYQARFVLAAVHAMLELKKSLFAIGINIIRD